MGLLCLEPALWEEVRLLVGVSGEEGSWSYGESGVGT